MSGSVSHVRRRRLTTVVSITAELPTRNDGTCRGSAMRRSRSIRVPHLADTPRGCGSGHRGRLIVASGDLLDELGALLDSNGRSLEELAGESDRPSDLLTAGARLVADGVLDICPPSGFGSDAGRSE